jgi:hypothetical protein
MMKKIFFIMLCAVGFSLISCGSTKGQDAGEIDSTEETTIAAPEEIDEPQQEAEQEAAEETQPLVMEEAEENVDEPEPQPSDSEYPPLADITEPDIIDIPVEEIIKKEQEKEEQAQAEKQKIEEPVPEPEELPPLPPAEEIDDTALRQAQEPLSDGVPEPVEGVEGQEETEATEETPVEPVIEIQEEPEEIIITPSRSVSLKKGETLVITYPGSGWIYMGSTSEYNNLASRGRKLGTTDTKYTLLAKEPGTQIHHFYKVDNLTGEYIDDYIEVTVLEKKGTSSTVVNAPDYKEVVPKKAEAPAKSSTTKKKEAEAQAQKQAEQEAKTETKTEAKTEAKTEVKKEAKAEESVIVIDDEETQVVEVLEESVEAIPDLDNYMTQAKDLINSKDYAKAYNMLTTYLEYANDGRDEALYILGQILEADSPVKNIKEAISTYQTLCDSYPASKYWDSANKRIIYLKRFYIDIH